jgi:hypothetical protein
MFDRPTSLGAAFVKAAIKVDHQHDPKQWVARRTLLNAERAGFAIVREHDRTPPKPNKVLDKATITAINAAVEELVEIGLAEKHMPAAGIEA